MANEKRLIDANALLEYVERQTRQIPAKEYDNDGFYHYSGWNGACVMARCAIKNAPTVDAAPVVHGRWEPELMPTGVEYSGWAEMTVQALSCSVCGKCIDVSEGYFSYCPNCGAKMDGGEKNER